jgi:hypothetical protein
MQREADRMRMQETHRLCGWAETDTMVPSHGEPVRGTSAVVEQCSQAPGWVKGGTLSPSFPLCRPWLGFSLRGAGPPTVAYKTSSVCATA